MDAGHVQASRGPYVAGEGTIRAFAEASVFGLPVERMLHTHDETERDFWNAVRQESAQVVETLMTNFARIWIREYASAKKRGSHGDGK